MKRVFAVCLTLIMVVCLSVGAFADSKGFVSSPSGKPAPRLVSFDPGDGSDTTAAIFPYSSKGELSDAAREMMEKAYKDIVEAEDLTKLSAALAKLAKKKKLDVKKLAVSDLFDIQLDGAGAEGAKDKKNGKLTFTLEVDNLKNFVGLLHMKNNGSWEIVDKAEVTKDGKNLKFTVDNCSPFAIVVNTGDPVPDNNTAIIVICAVAAVASLTALGFVLVKFKVIKLPKKK